MRINLITIVVVLFSLCPTALIAEDLDALTRQGIEYIQAGNSEDNFLEGLSLLTKAAKAGHPHARYALGFVAYQRENYEEARKWYQSAADEGHISAASALGAMLYHGEGGPLDPHQAIDWLLIGAEADISYAQYLMYEIYSGAERRIPYDTEKSLYWAERAAENGDADAMLIIGRAYEEGVGRSINMDKAIAFYKKATKQDLCDAYLRLGSTYHNNLYGAPQDKELSTHYLNAAIKSESCGSYERSSAKSMLSRLNDD